MRLYTNIHRLVMKHCRDIWHAAEVTSQTSLTDAPTMHVRLWSSSFQSFNIIKLSKFSVSDMAKIIARLYADEKDSCEHCKIQKSRYVGCWNYGICMTFWNTRPRHSGCFKSRFKSIVCYLSHTYFVICLLIFRNSNSFNLWAIKYCLI